jgi:HEAT repeat protein
MLPRAAAIRGLTRCRADKSLASDTIRALERAALPPNGRYVRAAAIRALGRVNDEQTVDALLSGVQSHTSDDPAMRALLISRLCELADEHDRHRARMAECLVDLLDGEPVAVRAAAIAGLGIVGDESIVPILEPLAGDDQPRSIRRAARSSMKAIQENDEK